MMRIARIPVLCFAPLALAASSGAAQVGTVPPGARAEAARACFRPAPLPRCRSFWITEFGLTRQLTSPPVVHDTMPGYSYPAGPGTDSVIVVPPEPRSYRPLHPTFVTWEVGAMMNRGEGRALGGSVFLAVPITGDARAHYGVRGRYRWWSVEGVTLDLSPGVYVTRDRGRLIDTGTPKRRVGLVLQATASKSDWLGVSAQADLDRDHSGAQVGARVGSVVGAVAGVGVPVVGLILFMLFPEG